MDVDERTGEELVRAYRSALVAENVRVPYDAFDVLEKTFCSVFKIDPRMGENFPQGDFREFLERKGLPGYSVIRIYKSLSKHSGRSVGDATNGDAVRLCRDSKFTRQTKNYGETSRRHLRGFLKQSGLIES